MIETFGLWFWVILGVALLLELFFIENVKPIAGAIVLTAVLAVFHFWSDIGWLKWIADHPFHFLGGVGVYLLLGLGWSVFKWVLFLRECALEYQQQRASWLRGRGIPNATLTTKVPEDLRKKWVESNDRWSPRTSRPPQAAQHKDVIITWMVFWPWSLLGSLIRDPFHFLYAAVASGLERLSLKIYRQVGYEEDRHIPEDVAEEPPKPNENPDEFSAADEFDELIRRQTGQPPRDL